MQNENPELFKRALSEALDAKASKIEEGIINTKLPKIEDKE